MEFLWHVGILFNWTGQVCVLEDTRYFRRLQPNSSISGCIPNISILVFG